VEVAATRKDIFFNKEYIVRGAYQLLTHIAPAEVDIHNEVILNTFVPLNVSLFAWRLLNNRLPLKDNLINHGMVHLNSLLCVGGCEVAETSNHLLFRICFLRAIWCNVMLWLVVHGSLLNVVDAHVLQFCNAYVFRNEVWLACCWTIWKERNKKCFNHSVTSVELLFDKVKITAWWWLKSNKKKVLVMI
jgi:hypothetical protein